MTDLKDGYNQVVNNYRSTKPKKVNGVQNSSYFYYYNKLMNMIYNIFEFKLPEEWDENYFKEKLFKWGYLIVTETSYGTVALKAGYDGINIYGAPVNFNITNPVLGNLRGVIGVDGYPIYLGRQNNHYINVNELVSRYAELLANVDGSLNTSLINSRVAHVFEAESTTQLKSLQKMYDEISEGKPAVFMREIGTDSNHTLFNNVKNTYIGNDLLLTKRTILNEFMSEIGINNNDVLKKERLISDEANSNAGELNANIYTWYSNLKKCIDAVNSAYNIGIGFDFNHSVTGVIDEHTEKNTEEDNENVQPN